MRLSIPSSAEACRYWKNSSAASSLGTTSARVTRLRVWGSIQRARARIPEARCSRSVVTFTPIGGTGSGAVGSGVLIGA